MDWLRPGGPDSSLTRAGNCLWWGTLRFNFSSSFSVRFLPPFIFNNMAGFVFGFVLGSFFQQLRVFSKFPASFLGSFGFVFWPLTCVFNNFPGSFFKNKIILSHTILGPKQPPHVFNDLRNIESLNRLFISTTASLRLTTPPRLKGYHASPRLSSEFRRLRSPRALLHPA